MEKKEKGRKHKRKTIIFVSIFVLSSILGVTYMAFFAQATVSVAHNAGCVQTASNTKTCTITVTITAGNTAIVAIETASGTSTVSSISGGGTYSERDVNTNTVRVHFWSTAIASATSASSVVITMVANGRFVAQALDVAGATFIGFTHHSGATGANPSDAQTIGSVNNWLFTAFAGNLATTPTSGTGTLYNAGSTTAIDGGLVSNTAASIQSVTTSETLASSTWAGSMVEFGAGILLSTSCTSGPTPLTANVTTYIQGKTSYVRFTCTVDGKGYTTTGAITATPSFTLPAPFTQLWSFESSTSVGTTCSAGTGAWQMTSGVSHTFGATSTTWDYCAVIPNTATADSTTFTVVWETT